MTTDIRRAVVTAGTGGLGLQTAIGLASRGWQVTVVGRDAERGAAAVARIDGPPPAGRAASSARICPPWRRPGSWERGSPRRAPGSCW
ncbi:SDR family NAD(P)-dependent oxidoreductase [Streptomyces sp. enrichment culture]|uniref:SDR family NAD(P)-dependent oxidoreductase n=1 Tax=Streptomyces sp. enrichment culture TaxID=1795815 RepID=UPI003F55A450